MQATMFQEINFWQERQKLVRANLLLSSNHSFHQKPSQLGVD